MGGGYVSGGSGERSGVSVVRMVTRTWQLSSSTSGPQLPTCTQVSPLPGLWPAPCGASCLECSVWTSTAQTPTHLLRLAQKSPLVYEAPPDSPGESHLVLPFPTEPYLLHALMTAQAHMSPQSICTFPPCEFLEGRYCKSILLCIPPPNIRPGHGKHLLNE